MAVESGETPLGTNLPDVTLPDLDGAEVSLRELRGDGVLVVVFSANHCPYVQHVEGRLGEVAAGVADAGVQFVAIGSNDVTTYPADDVAGLREQVQRAGWQFPYLMDLDQSVAKQFGAVCTPDFFVFGIDGTLVYRGAFDASSPMNNRPLDGGLLQAAVDAAVAGDSIPPPHRPAMGCGIKWLPGNEPEAVSFV
jgi:peroxiredoxin